MAEHASRLPRIAGIVWLVGALWALGLLCAGLVRLTWIGARCEPLIDPQWTDLLGEIAAHLQLRRDVVLLQ